MSAKALRAARAINWALALATFAYQLAVYLDVYPKQDSAPKQAAVSASTLVVVVAAYCAARAVDALLRLWSDARDPKKR